MKCSKCGHDGLKEALAGMRAEQEKFKKENGDKPYISMRDLSCQNCTGVAVSKLKSEPPLPPFVTVMYACGSIVKSEKAGEWTIEKPCPREKPCTCICTCVRCAK